MDCARAVLGGAGGANILLYPHQTFGVVQDGRNLLTQQVTHSSLAATFNPGPKQTASQGVAPAKLRGLHALQWGLCRDSKGSCVTPGTHHVRRALTQQGLLSHH